MAGAGPAPKDPAHRRRRNSTGAARTPLPEKRTARAPRWPLDVAKPACWVGLWRLPQATVWEQHKIVRVVARYALLLEQAEVPGASSALLAEVRQLEDRLGLNPKAMRSLLWEITTDEAPEPVVATGETARKRLRIVN